MDDLANGYTTDIMYENGYFRELSPDFLRASLLLQGFDLPSRNAGEPLRYLELGYGQGLSLNVHSAAHAGEFWGTDIHPGHVLHAKALASQAGLGNRVLGLGFAELDQESLSGALPPFDIIALHGVWSWISHENRAHVLNIIRRNLKPGGVVYISYNTLPGWAPFMPVRELLCMYADAHALPQPESDLEELIVSVTRTREAYRQVMDLCSADALYFTKNPLAKQVLESLEGKSMAYVIHEYMNRDWQPFYFADLAATMATVQCGFVTSAHLFSQYDLFLPPKTKACLAAASTPEMRETLRDFAFNRQFRADLFTRGSQRLPADEQFARLAAIPWGLTCQHDTERTSLKTSYGTVLLQEDVYNPLFATLAEASYAPKTFGELAAHPALIHLEQPVLLEALSVLMAAGLVSPTRPANANITAACKRLNSALCLRAQTDPTPASVLASPVLGGAVGVSSLEQLFLLARHRGKTLPAEWAQETADIFAERGQKLVHDEVELAPAEALAEITSLAEAFTEIRLPYLEAVGAVPE